MATLAELSKKELDARDKLLDDRLATLATVDDLSPAGLDLREQELNARLLELGATPDPTPELLTPQESFDKDKSVQKLAQEFPNNDPNDIDANFAALQENPEVVNKIGFKEVFANKDFFEALPFVGPLYKLETFGEVLQASTRLSQDKDAPKQHLFESDEQFMDRRIQFLKDMKTVEKWLAELERTQDRGLSVGGRIAEGIIALPGFMVEFLLTGPVFKTGSAAAKNTATKLLGRFADKGVGKWAVRAAGAGFGTLLRTAVNVPRVLQGAAERMSEGLQITDDGVVVFADAQRNPFSALARSFLDLYIENLSEISGPSLKKGVVTIGKGIGKRFPVLGKFTQGLADKWIANKAGRTFADFLKASATKVGYDGILEEMGEERVGAILRAVTGLGTFGEIIPTWEDLLVEAGIFSVPGAVSLAANKTFRKDEPTEPVEKRLGFVGEEVLFLEKREEAVTPELLMQNRIRLFESLKNVTLSKQEEVAALDFMRERIGIKELTEKDRIRINANLPDDFERFAVGLETKIKETTAETKSDAIQANVKESSVEPTGTLDAIRRNVLRAEDALGFWGTAGKKVQRDLREISARTAKNVGNTSQNIRRILFKITDKEKIVVAQLADGAISTEGQPRRLRARANLLKRELDIMQNEAISVGLRKGKLTGKAFPQVLNAEGKAFVEEAELKGARSRRVFAWAQTKVEEGKFDSVDSAIAAIQKYRKERLRGTEGYFEGERILDLDLEFREWSPDKVLPGIIEGGWEAIEGARQWGVTKDGNFRDIRTTIERIRVEVGNDQATLLEDYIKAQYGQSRASVAARTWNKRARSVQFVGKLALSPLTITRNMLDRYAKGLTHGTIGTNIRATVQFPPFLNKFMPMSQRIQDQMIRQGAVLGHGHLSEGFASGGKISRFVGQPFAQSERGNQTYIAIVKQLQLQKDIQRLHELGGETGTIAKMYDRFTFSIGSSQSKDARKQFKVGSVVLKFGESKNRNRLLSDVKNEELVDALASGEQLAPEEMSEILHRVTTDSAFPLTLASKRMWWGNRPFVQSATQFKVWSADQMRFIYRDVLKYTIATGDPSRLARFMIGTWLAGEIYNIARDFLTDKDESLVSTLRDPDGRNAKEISKSIGNALVDGGIVGMLADLTYGITDWTFGPTVGSIESLARTAVAVKNDPATTVDGLKRFLLEDVPVAKQAQGVLDRIDRTFFDKDNLTEKYAEWRKRSFDFRKKKDQLTTIERTTGRVVLGRPARLPGPRTLSLEMIARQVLVDDAADAADYIVGIFKDTKPEKLKDLRASFRQSAVNNSPLGNIAKEDIPEFLAQFSAEGQAEIIALQKQWGRNYNEAFVIAAKKLKEDKFFEEVLQNLKKE